jgi:cation:H+ antiporter
VFDLALLVGLAAAGTALAWKGGEALVHASDRLGAYYGLPAIVQGAIIAAVGSSFPELSSTIIAAARYGEFEIGIGAIVGSAVFNILVIPAISALLGEGSLASNRDLVYKEAQFYILSIAALLLTFSMAVIYFPVGGTGTQLEGTLPRWLALVPIAFYGVYIFIQYHDTMEYVPDVPVDTSQVQPTREWGRLGLSLLLILAGAELLVRAAVGLGAVFGTSTFLWGLTVVAAGTSLPDTFVSVTAARVGNASVSLANVLGSNIFALLVALPAGVIVAGSAPVDFAVVVPMMGFLIVASIAFFGVLRTDMVLSSRESYFLLVLYGVFLAWLVAESLGVTNFVQL